VEISRGHVVALSIAIGTVIFSGCAFKEEQKSDDTAFLKNWRLDCDAGCELEFGQSDRHDTDDEGKSVEVEKPPTP
jgi:hypothetical protein